MNAAPPRAPEPRALLVVAAAMLLTLPLLMAPKCFDYDAPVVPDGGMTDSGTFDAAPTDSSADAPLVEDTGMVFVPAVPCPTPDTATLLVRNLEYQIVCGCREAAGKVCTLPRGATVIWNFADAVEHNVSAIEEAFGGSTDRLSGRHTQTFDEPGTFGYGCTLHPGPMSGYSLVVE